MPDISPAKPLRAKLSVMRCAPVARDGSIAMRAGVQPLSTRSIDENRQNNCFTVKSLLGGDDRRADYSIGMCVLLLSNE